jgi:hypothetical protein
MTKAKLLKTLLLGAVVLVALGFLIRSNETASEVALTSFGNFFGLVTTPFILEASTAILGLIIVLTYNQWRIDQEGDGWVILPEDEAKHKSADSSGKGE